MAGKPVWKPMDFKKKGSITLGQNIFILKTSLNENNSLVKIRGQCQLCFQLVWSGL